MASALTQRYISFFAAYPRPELIYGTAEDRGKSWNQLCAKGQYRFNRWLGWLTEPRVTGPGAVHVGRASRLNGLSTTAPIGAWHFWSIGTYGHVGQETEGGGSCVAMFGTEKLTDRRGPFIGFSTIQHYGAATYMGWSLDYAGGTSRIPQDVLAPNERRVVPDHIANRRVSPTALSALAGEPLKAGTVGTFTGWINGQLVSQYGVTTPVWYRGISGHWFWAGAFVGGADTRGLEDLNPKPVPTPPQTVTITFDSKGGSSTPLAQVVTKGSYAVAPAMPIREGFRFAGWVDESGTVWDFSQPVSKSLTLSANWDVQLVSVAFMPEGGTPDPDDRLVEYGDPVERPEDPTKEGFSFAEWIGPTGLPWDFSAPVQTDLVLTAMWLLNPVEPEEPVDPEEPEGPGEVDPPLDPDPDIPPMPTPPARNVWGWIIAGAIAVAGIIWGIFVPK